MMTEVAAISASAFGAADPLARGRTGADLRLVADVSADLMGQCELLLAEQFRPGNIFQFNAMTAAAMHPELMGDRRTVFAVVCRDQQVRSIWPLHLARHFGVMVASDLTAPISQYSDVIGDPLSASDLRALALGLRKTFGADALLARRVRGDSGLNAAFEAHAPASVTTSSAAPFINLKSYPGFEAYAVARFGKKTMRMRRQRRQKLESVYGPLHFTVLRGQESRDKLVTALQWKRDWLEARNIVSQVFDGSSNEGMLRRVSGNGNIFASVLSAGDRPVAIEIGIAHGGHYAAYLGAFDPEFTRFSPGQEQMLRTLEWCFAEGFSRYDLLPPDDDYKLGWTDTREPVSDHCLALSPLGSGYVLLRRLGHSRMNSILRALPTKARRYGPAAVGVGAAAAALGILAD